MRATCCNALRQLPLRRRLPYDAVAIRNLYLNPPMRILTALLLLLSLSACGLYYHTPVRQGNVLTPDQVARLEPGMTRQQVRYLMGTPLVASHFEDNRWDYVFYYRNPNARVRQSKISLYFVDNRLTDIEGDEQFLQASHGGRLAPTTAAAPESSFTDDIDAASSAIDDTETPTTSTATTGATTG